MLRPVAFLLLLAALAGGCVRALPSAAQYPSPVPSAAQPGATGRGDMAYARSAQEAIRKALRDFDPEDALTAVPDSGIDLPDAGVVASCAAAGGQVPVLVCHFGPTAAQPVAQGLFWYERDGWQAQLYPPAPFHLMDERKEAFAELGCQIGCYSGVVQARQLAEHGGLRLLVVVNLGHSSGVHAEEVQVLRLKEGSWATDWVPAPGDWHYGHTVVSLAPRGIETFQLSNSSWLREDPLTGYLAEPEAGEHRRFTERWVRKGTGYMMHDKAEEATSFSALIRVIHYLSRGAEEKAQALMDSEIDLDEARSALAQRPPRQSWGVTRLGADGYLLDRTGAGKPDLGVRFERRGDGWMLAEIWRTGR